MLIFLTIFYVIGAALAAFMMYRQNKLWLSQHPEDRPTRYEYGFWVVGTCLSWLTVGLLAVCSVASANRLDEDYFDNV